MHLTISYKTHLELMDDLVTEGALLSPLSLLSLDLSSLQRGCRAGTICGPTNAIMGEKGKIGASWLPNFIQTSQRNPELLPALQGPPAAVVFFYFILGIITGMCKADFLCPPQKKKTKNQPKKPTNPNQKTNQKNPQPNKKQSEIEIDLRSWSEVI